jgi:hypothetical protein
MIELRRVYYKRTRSNESDENVDRHIEYVDNESRPTVVKPVRNCIVQLYA